MKKFLKLWAIYSLVINGIYFSFILPAFIGISIIAMVSYTSPSEKAKVVLYFLIIPMALLSLVSAVIAFIHSGIENYIKNPNKFGFFQIIQIITCIPTIAFGSGIILANAPEEYAKHGLLKTLFVASFFFIPLIFLPITVLISILRQFLTEYQGRKAERIS